MTDPAAPPLAVDDAMPDVGLVAPDGTRSSLDEVRAGRPAVVYFMRSATCPVCRRHVASLTGLAGSGRLAGRALLVLVPGDAPEAATVRQRHPSPVAEVWATGSGHADVGLGTFMTLQHSGSFALDDAGRVVYRRTGALPVRNLDVDELLAVLAT